MRVAVLIPAHNEAKTIRTVAEGARAKSDWVVVIDDGSTDQTAESLDGLDVEVIRHTENRGKGIRLAEGLDHAAGKGADAVITMDADGQHDVEEIPRFIAAAESHPRDLILGDRTADMESMPAGRRWANRVANFFVSWACAQRMPDTQCGFRVYPVTLWQELRLREREMTHFVFETAILLRAAEAGFGFFRVPVAARYHGFVHRPSHFRPFLDIARITAMVTRFIVSGGFRPRGLLIALRWTR